MRCPGVQSREKPSHREAVPSPSHTHGLLVSLGDKQRIPYSLADWAAKAEVIYTWLGLISLSVAAFATYSFGGELFVLFDVHHPVGNVENYEKQI